MYVYAGAPAGNPLLPAEVSESTPMDLDKGRFVHYNVAEVLTLYYQNR